MTKSQGIAAGYSPALAGRLAVLSLTMVAPAGAQQAPAPAAALVFDNVTVVDVEQGKLVPDQRVVIAGARIQAVGDRRGVPIPAGSQVVMGAGRYLIPGLWDMHIHLTKDVPEAYQLFLANGVTGFREAGSGAPLDSLRQWRDEIRAGTRVGPPRQIFSSVRIREIPALDSFRLGGLGGVVYVSLKDSTNPARLIEVLRAAGVDMLKTYSLSRPLYFALARAARAAGIPFGGHAGRILRPSQKDPAPAVTLREASDSGAGIVDHLSSGFDFCWVGKRFDDPLEPPMAQPDPEQCRNLAERFRRNNTWFMPDIVDGLVGSVVGPYTVPIRARFQEHLEAFRAGASLAGAGNWLRDTPRGQGAPSADTAAAADSARAMALMHRVGLPIVAGSDRTDAWGFQLHEELAVLVAEGLTPLAALQAATLNPAKMWRATDSLGTVAAGKLADLVLLDANPLADITNTTTIRAVVANGRYFDRETLDQLLATVQAKWKKRKKP